jgi:hypothetical protein
MPLVCVERLGTYFLHKNPGQYGCKKQYSIPMPTETSTYLSSMSLCLRWSCRARICKFLSSPGIGSKGSIPGLSLKVYKFGLSILCFGRVQICTVQNSTVFLKSASQHFLSHYTWVSAAILPSVFPSYIMFRLFSLLFYFLLNERPSNLLYHERCYVLPASQQIIPVAGSKWRPQEDLSPCQQNRPRIQSNFLHQERRCVMLASRQIFPVVSIKWRPQDDLSSLSAELALIIFLLSVSGAALSDAGLTPDLPRGQYKVEATGGLVLLVSRTGLPTFSIRSSIM